MDDFWIDNTGARPDEFELGCAVLLRGKRVLIASLSQVYDWHLRNWANDIIAWMPKRDVAKVLRSNYKEKNHGMD